MLEDVLGELVRESGQDTGRMDAQTRPPLNCHLPAWDLARSRPQDVLRKVGGKNIPTWPHHLFSQKESRFFSHLCPSNRLCWMSGCGDKNSELPGHTPRFILPKREVFPG